MEPIFFLILVSIGLDVLQSETQQKNQQKT